LTLYLLHNNIQRNSQLVETNENERRNNSYLILNSERSDECIDFTMISFFISLSEDTFSIRKKFVFIWYFYVVRDEHFQWVTTF